MKREEEVLNIAHALMPLNDLDSGQTIGEYVKGHVSREAFVQALSYESIDGVAPEAIKHEMWRWVPCPSARARKAAKPWMGDGCDCGGMHQAWARPGVPGAFTVTVWWK